MSETAIIAIAGAAGTIGFFLVIQLPEIMEKWGKAKSEMASAAMKQQMIERGFSADEIVQVLSAGSREADKEPEKLSKPRA